MPLVDVYALGIVAYELFTGRRPFESEHATPLFGMQLTVEPPPLRTHRPQIPIAVERAVLRALAKRPGERTPSAEHFRRELAAAWDEAPDSEPLSILVADDDPGLRALIAQVLRSAFPSAEVRVVPDGAAALSAVQSSRPRLVVSDLDMPVMNGLELIAALRADPQTRETPIVIATAVGGPGEWRRLSALGATAFLVKPFEPAHLVGVVENILAVRAAWRPRS